MWLENGHETLSLFETADLGKCGHVLFVQVISGAQAKAMGGVEKAFLKKHRVVIRPPPHALLQGFCEGYQGAELWEEHHVAAEVVFKLVTKVRVAAPQQLGVL